jgi:hypothetical protein
LYMSVSDLKIVELFVVKRMAKLVKKALLFFIIPFLFIFPIHSYQDSPSTKRPQITIPKVSKPPELDGRLDDECWKIATRVDNFYKFAPVDGEPASEKTEAYIAYDRENFYIAFRCFDQEKDKIRAHISKRDYDMLGDDHVIVVLDTFNSQRRGYELAVNPFGIQFDAILQDGGLEDMSFDLIYYSNGELTDFGYTVEIAIPFKSLRFPPGELQSIGFTAARNIKRKNEQCSWPAFDISKNTVFDQFAEIVGLEGIEYSKNIEILPSFTGLQIGERNNEGAFENKSFEPDFGIGLKYGITPNVTLDFTYNPDFSQVEADAGQVDVNLRYELYFEEKRPFFLEGADIFQTDIEAFYSRRIIDPLYGAKVTGKIGKATFAFLSALDEGPGKEWGEEENAHLGERALVNIFRGKYDLLKNSYLGFLMTSRQFANRSNQVVGVDGILNFKRNYRFSFQGLGSFTATEKGDKQNAPALTTKFSRDSRHLNFYFYYRDLYPDFNADVGFIKRTDIREGKFNINYRFLPNKNWILTLTPNYSFDRYYDHNGIIVEQNNEASMDLEFSRQTYFTMSFNDNLERWADIDFKKKLFDIQLRSSLTTYFYGGFYFQIGKSIYYSLDNPYLGYKRLFTCWLNLRPNSRLKAELDFTKSTFWYEKGGELVYDYNIIRSKTTYQFTKRLFLRSIIEYNDYRDEVTSDILLSYFVNHGTVFFLGYGGLFEKEYDPLNNRYLDFQQSKRSFFIKLSYLWRV